MPYTPTNNPYVPGDPYMYDLNWIVAKLKEAIALYQPLSDEFSALHDYVMNYFANLDLTAEVSAKIDQMAANGTLDAIIKPYFDAYKAEINADINGLNNSVSDIISDIDVLDARMDTFSNLPSGSTAGDAELMDIRVGANGKTYATAGDAVRAQISDLSDNINANAASDEQLNYYNGFYEYGGSTNWAAYAFAGKASKWNGTFGTGNANYYLDLCNPTYTTQSLSGIRNNATPLTGLTPNHKYEISSRILNGTVTMGASEYFRICFYNPAQGTVEVPLNSKKSFVYSSGSAIFFLKISKNVAINNALISISISDITEKEENATLKNGFIEVPLRGYSWGNGRHITVGNPVNSPTSSANTICLLDAIPYDYDMYFEIANGWTAAFVSVSNGIVTGIAGSYLTAGRVSMLDIFNNLSYPTANEFGDKLSINLRNSDNTGVDFYNINIDDIIKAYKVIRTPNPNSNNTKWVAIGDSITDGRYSQSDGTVRTKTNHFAQYGYIASKIIGIDNYVEYGYGGMGYVSPANDGVTYLDDVLNIDFGNPDIITVNLGVNDRSKPLGDINSMPNDGTISGSIRNCCEVLGATYPHAHIIFMTPLNCSRTGDISTGWAKRSGPTHLEDIATMIKYWANKYGFTVIDMLNNSPINDFNITSILLDKEHPTMEGHLMVGQYLAAEMPIKL